MTPDAVLTPDDVRHFVATRCFPDVPVGTVGVELEWFVVDDVDPLSSVPPPRTSRAVAAGDPLPGGGRVSFEPGGQVELSSPPARLTDCLAVTRADAVALAETLREDDLTLVALGTDPIRAACHWLRLPRYLAMRDYFGPGLGPVMMCSTASLQLNLDVGTGAAKAARWRHAHAIGPVLVAAFATSPVLGGRLTGWRSTRQAVWAGLDADRTAAAVGAADDPIEAWSRYLLAARLMLVRTTGGGCAAVRDGSTFHDWIAGGGPLPRPPDLDDLAYHATTVFPPVRPRGWLELRYLDALPQHLWPVAVAVTTALLDDPVAADIAADACAVTGGRWLPAARSGLSDPQLRAAARSCFAAAVAALPRLGADAELIAAVASYADRYVDTGRCPADDLAERATAEGPAALLRSRQPVAPVRGYRQGSRGCWQEALR